MIFLESKGRFGNFLFQFFFAKLLQKELKKKIIIFSEAKNNSFFINKNNLYSLTKGCYFLPKFSSLLNIFKKNFFYFNDKNYKTNFSEKKYLNYKMVYLDGFFQDINLIDDNVEILDNILNLNKAFKNYRFIQTDLTIHIRHLNANKNSIDDHPLYKTQPSVNFYQEIISNLKPKKIKVISSSKDNKILNQLEKIYKNKLIVSSNNEFYDFLDLINSQNLILSNSTFSIWAGLLSKANNIYIPNIGILKKILNKKKLNIKSKLIYLN